MLRRLFCTLALASVLSAADPWVGVWKMNYEKTKSPTTPPKDVVLTYEATPQGVKFTSSGKLPDGSPYGYNFAAAIDGRDYPVHGHPVYTTVALTGNQGKLEITFKANGKVVTKHITEFFADGKVMTTTSDWKNPNGETYKTVGYFDKQ